MLDNIVRRELIAVEKVMGCCEHVIVGKSGNKNYFVSLNKLNALSGLSKKIKKAIGQYSEVVDYQDEYFVIVPYSVLFRYFSEGEMNACS